MGSQMRIIKINSLYWKLFYKAMCVGSFICSAFVCAGESLQGEQSKDYAVPWFSYTLLFYHHKSPDLDRSSRYILYPFSSHVNEAFFFSDQGLVKKKQRYICSN